MNNGILGNVMINILLSTYNGAEYIEEQLESIFAQTYQDFFVYIRDDGSQDETVQIIQEYIEKIKQQHRVKIFTGENIGFSQSFAELLRISNDGKYWAFCDQDDIWLPDKLSYAVEHLGRIDKNKPALYHGSFYQIDSSGNQIGEYILNPKHYTFRESLTSSICYGFTIVINSKLRELMLKSDYSQIQSHDWYASMIAAAFGVIIFDNRIVAKHRIHGKNDSPNNMHQKIKRGRQLLSGDSFYTKNAREFYQSFYKECDEQQKKMLERFQMRHYSIFNACYKAFFPQRWNRNIAVELVLRGLMLIGKI